MVWRKQAETEGIFAIHYESKIAALSPSLIPASIFFLITGKTVYIIGYVYDVLLAGTSKQGLTTITDMIGKKLEIYIE